MVVDPLRRRRDSCARLGPTRGVGSADIRRRTVYGCRRDDERCGLRWHLGTAWPAATGAVGDLWQHLGRSAARHTRRCVWHRCRDAGSRRTAGRGRVNEAPTFAGRPSRALHGYGAANIGTLVRYSISARFAALARQLAVPRSTDHQQLHCRPSVGVDGVDALDASRAVALRHCQPRSSAPTCAPKSRPWAARPNLGASMTPMCAGWRAIWVRTRKQAPVGTVAKLVRGQAACRRRSWARS